MGGQAANGQAPLAPKPKISRGARWGGREKRCELDTTCVSHDHNVFFPNDRAPAYSSGKAAEEGIEKNDKLGERVVVGGGLSRQ